MSITLKLKRGLKANLPIEAPLGEPLIALDSRELYLGQGAGMPLVKIGATRADEIIIDPKWDLASDTVQEALFEIKQILTDKINGVRFTDLVGVSDHLVAGASLKLNEDGSLVESFLLDITPSAATNDTISYAITSSSSEASHPAHFAFDHATLDYWSSLQLASIGYEFKDAIQRRIFRYALTAPLDTEYAGPRSFVLEAGESATSALATLDVKSGITFNPGERKEFTLEAPANYAYYQIRVTELDPTKQNIALSQIEFLGDGLGVLLNGKATTSYVDDVASLLQTQIDAINDASYTNVESIVNLEARVLALETELDGGAY